MPNFLISKKAEKDLKQLSESDRKRVIKSLLAFKADSKNLDIKKLSHSKNYYRIRNGNYRIVYEINKRNDEIKIFRIRHRKEVYQKL